MLDASVTKLIHITTFSRKTEWISERGMGKLEFEVGYRSVVSFSVGTSATMMIAANLVGPSRNLSLH